MIGTPLQAMKFANTVGDDAQAFVWSWVRDDLTGIKSAWPGFEQFCKDNPDPVPDWFGKFDEQVIRDCMSDALSNGEGQVSGRLLLKELTDAGLQLVPIEKDRGDGRKLHYGTGRQPLDDIIDAGWGGAFCAGNVLKYLRRDKQVEDSRIKARWYYNKLNELREDPKTALEAHRVSERLLPMLSDGEAAVLVLG